MLQPLRVVRDVRLADPRSREELALVVEEHLVLVDVRVEEGDAQRGGVAGLRRPRREQSDLEPVGLPHGMDARRHVVAR